MLHFYSILTHPVDGLDGVHDVPLGLAHLLPLRVPYQPVQINDLEFESQGQGPD